MLLKLSDFSIFLIEDTGKINVAFQWCVLPKLLLVYYANILEVRCGRYLFGAN